MNVNEQVGPFGPCESCGRPADHEVILKGVVFALCHGCTVKPSEAVRGCCVICPHEPTCADLTAAAFARPDDITGEACS